MKLEIDDRKGKKTVRLSGEIDMYSSPDLREELVGLIAKKTPVLCVDFGQVSYIDSSGIATFVESLKEMKSYGGRLQLLNIPPVIMEIFMFSKLDRVFEISNETDVVKGE